MNRPLPTLAATVIALLLTTHPLPAPIHETPPKPATPKPAPKPAPKPKPKQPAETKPAPSATPRKRGAYAGTWVGTIAHGIRGSRENTVIIDDSQTSMRVSDVKTPRGHTFSGPASVGESGMTGSFGLMGGTWTLKPYPDGNTAQVNLIGGYFHSSAIFRREK